jgi:hypothetical protein
MPKVETSMVECRVLSDCPFGQWGEVVRVEKSVAESACFLDPHPDAVAAAKAALTTPE